MSDSSEPASPKAPAAPLAQSQAEALPFEAALEKLESIVENLESGDVPLSDLLNRYEEANGLLKACQQQLDAAQLRIERLARKDGQNTLEPFTPEA